MAKSNPSTPNQIETVVNGTSVGAGNLLEYGFLAGGGEMGKLTRQYDWATSPVGPVESWPQSLKTSVSIVINSAFPMFIWWGREAMTNFYNDSYIEILGSKHPLALGESGRQVWKEIWNDVGPLADHVFSTGEAMFIKDLRLDMNRHGYEEETYFTFSYSPIRDEDGKIGGLICSCTETTKEVMAKRQLQANELALNLERNRMHDFLAQSPAAMAVVRGKDFIIELANPIVLQLWGRSHDEVINKPLLEALPEVQDQGIKELLDGVVATGQPYIGNALRVELDRQGNGQLEECYFNLVYAPFRQDDGSIDGVIVFAYEVTEQIQARSQVEISEERYRMLFNSIDQGFCVIDVIFDEHDQPIDYRFAEVNKVFSKQTGLKDVQGKTARQILPDLEDFWFERYGEVAKTGKGQRFDQESRVMGRWFDVYAVRVGGQDSRRVAILFTDITEQRQRENEIKNRLRQQNVVTELGLKALGGANVETLMQDAAEQLQDVLGVDFVKVLELLPGSKELLLRAGVGWHSNITLHETTLPAGRGSQSGYTLMVKRPVIIKDLPTDNRFQGPELLKDHGVISGMSCIIQGKDSPFGVLGVHSKTPREFSKMDVTFLQAVANVLAEAILRSKSRLALMESEARFTALTDANLLGIIVADKQGHISEANESFLKMMGYTKKEVAAGKLRWDKLTPGEYVDEDSQHINSLFESGQATPWEKEFIRRDGSQIPVIVGGAVLKRSDGTFVAFILDITERKKLEQRKDEFISIASHELKTPLTSVKGYVQILERIIKEMGDEKAYQYVSRTNTYVDRLNSLISDLLDVSKIQAGKLQLTYEAFDVDEMIQDAIESIQPTSTKHKITVEGVVGRKLYGDRHRLEQVMTNLLSNAMKYAPNAHAIYVRAKRQNKVVIIEVQDFGVGIAKDKQGKLFQRFYRVEDTEKQFSGMGIGLYISSEIVKRHGGQLGVNSEPKKGSTFTVTLPITTASAIAEMV
jgi:PAS domain S-box-containing protein